MCTQARLVFTCNHSRPLSAAKRCEWAAMKGIDCPESMVDTDYDGSQEIMYDCLACLTKKGDCGEKKGKVEKLLGKILGKRG